MTRKPSTIVFKNSHEVNYDHVITDPANPNFVYAFIERDDEPDKRVYINVDEIERVIRHE